MKMEDCAVGLVVALTVRGHGHFICDVVRINRESVSVQVRNAKFPRPVTVDPRRLWSMEHQLPLL